MIPPDEPATLTPPPTACLWCDSDLGGNRYTCQPCLEAAHRLAAIRPRVAIRPSTIAEERE